MILSGSFFGISYFKNTASAPPIKGYGKLSFLGNNNFSNIHIIDRIRYNPEINNIDITQVPKWDSETLLLATFQTKSLSAGNIIDLSSPIVRWNVSRREIGSNIIKNVANTTEDKLDYIDYTVQANKEYQYLIFPETQDEIGVPLESELMKSNFYGWYLIDELREIVYMFDLNLETGDIPHNTDTTVFQNNTKYPKISKSDMNYRTGQISCIAGSINVDGRLEQSVDYINEIQEFINNDTIKLLKSRKGDIMRVTTDNFSYKHMDDIAEQPITIKFQFTEVGDV